MWLFRFCLLNVPFLITGHLSATEHKALVLSDSQLNIPEDVQSGAQIPDADFAGAHGFLRYLPQDGSGSPLKPMEFLDSFNAEDCHGVDVSVFPLRSGQLKISSSLDCLVGEQRIDSKFRSSPSLNHLHSGDKDLLCSDKSLKRNEHPGTPPLHQRFFMSKNEARFKKISVAGDRDPKGKEKAGFARNKSAGNGFKWQGKAASENLRSSRLKVSSERQKVLKVNRKQDSTLPDLESESQIKNIKRQLNDQLQIIVTCYIENRNLRSEYEADEKAFEDGNAVDYPVGCIDPVDQVINPVTFRVSELSQLSRGDSLGKERPWRQFLSVVQHHLRQNLIKSELVTSFNKKVKRKKCPKNAVSDVTNIDKLVRHGSFSLKMYKHFYPEIETMLSPFKEEFRRLMEFTHMVVRETYLREKKSNAYIEKAKSREQLAKFLFLNLTVPVFTTEVSFMGDVDQRLATFYGAKSLLSVVNIYFDSGCQWEPVSKELSSELVPAQTLWKQFDQFFEKVYGLEG